ncbi:MAG: serine/threonine protein kinase [Planctomycetes bacterium]|nr:serine/threonine protein kinase [Planctomycetota bacterium]
MQGDPRLHGWHVGGVVDDYRLERRLGGGGMGEVWAATQRSTGALRAIKTLHASASPEEHARLAREGRALAALQGHPNLIRVHSAGQAHGRGYLVLDHAAGGDLLQRLKQGPLPEAAARELTATLADALAHVHAARLFHRDLKPQNVLFGEDGRPLLCDFGLVGGVARGSLTQSHDILGTPAYMAPEQALGQAVDARTDVYGLGAVLYHVLCGRPPFESSSPVESMRQVIEQAPRPPSQVAAGVAPELERVCLRALAKDPDERYPDALALRAALLASPAPAGSLAPLVAAVALAVVSLAAAGGVVLSRGGRPPASASPAARSPLHRDPSPPPPDPKQTAKENLERLYAQLPGVGALEQDLDPKSLAALFPDDPARFRIQGSHLLEAVRDPRHPPASPQVIAGWFAAGIHAGDERAAGFLAKLLADEKEALWPDEAEREGMIHELALQSAEAGCLSAISWVCECMLSKRHGFEPDPALAQRWCLAGLKAEHPPTDMTSVERRVRYDILRLSLARPEAGPPIEAQLEHVAALCEPRLWELLVPAQQQWLLAQRRTLLGRLGAEQLARFTAEHELDRDLLRRAIPPSMEWLTQRWEPDPASDRGGGAFVAGTSIGNFVRNSQPASAEELQLQACLLLLASGEAGHDSAWFELSINLQHASEQPWRWAREVTPELLREVLQHGHTRGDRGASVELAHEALTSRAVPADPVYARAMLEGVSDVKGGPYRVLWKYAATHALLSIEHPEVGSPLDGPAIQTLLDFAIQEGTHDPDQQRALTRLRERLVAATQRD